jgi:type I restriction enzyme S subunit
MAFNQQLNAIVPTDRDMARWIFYAVQGPLFQAALDSASSATTVAIVNKRRFASLELPVAPLPEQRRVVEVLESYLSRLDDAVACLVKVLAELKAYRAAVLKAAVEGLLVQTEASLARAEKRDYEPAEVLLSRVLEERRRRWEEAELAKYKVAGKPPKDDKWKAKYQEPAKPDMRQPQKLPAGWCWASVDQLTDGARNSGYGVLVPGPDVADGVPMIRVGDIHDGTVSVRELKRIDRRIADRFAKTYLSGGEVLLSLVGTIGRSAVVPASLSGANVARAVGVMPMSGLIRSRWVEIWFRSPRLQALMNSRAHEVARKTLNLEDVRATAVAVPPLGEQDRIIADVEDVESIAAATASTVAANSLRSIRLRQSVLKWAFEGMLTDQNPDDEPAKVLLARIQAQRSMASSTKKSSSRAKKRAA